MPDPPKFPCPASRQPNDHSDHSFTEHDHVSSPNRSGNFEVDQLGQHGLPARW